MFVEGARVVSEEMSSACVVNISYRVSMLFVDVLLRVDEERLGDECPVWMIGQFAFMSALSLIYGA